MGIRFGMLELGEVESRVRNGILGIYGYIGCFRLFRVMNVL